MSDKAADRRVAVITGAAEGLGAEIAGRLARDGYSVAMLDLNAEGLQRTAAAIEQSTPGRVVLTRALDLADEEAVAEAFAAIDSAVGRVDALVNTAGGSGTTPVRDITDLTLETWNRVLGSNVTSAFLCSKHAIPIMRRGGRGRIVNFSSGVSAGLAGPSGTVGARLAYASAKGAINSLTKQLSKDLAHEGITVNALSPGLILPVEGRVRRVFEALPDSERSALLSANPMGRLGSGAEIAAAVAYLVSDEAGFTSGAILGVDGATS